MAAIIGRRPTLTLLLERLEVSKGAVAAQQRPELVVVGPAQQLTDPYTTAATPEDNIEN
jgi:hypothetical protein